MKNDIRVDQLLVTRDLARSRTEAQKLIVAGAVEQLFGGNWLVIKKPSERLPEHIELRVEITEEQRFVSRAGLKLEAAIKHSDLNPSGYLCLDVGQSTGGFTDCLLQYGAAKIIGVEVGHGQLAQKMVTDKRVVCVEGYNARHLSVDTLPVQADEKFDLVVMDVSFISQHLILPNLPPLLKTGATLISLVKPQFEVGKDNIGKGGVVRDAALYPQVKAKMIDCLITLGFNICGYIPSPISGGDGNREFLVIANYVGLEESQ
ncbi:TlyA family RNA methyltransferase [Teredinibacter waterburyi]|jgi:hemolysin TlyA family protein|uniref:TlyA family RNA methyltransferase n=1 Tax=Teredinibacter waterburyi TaxID=1500538 RepID=UPI00165FD178|nr:TlyA family RNA methyltransferase [Teredinibacter waterburyi]